MILSIKSFILWLVKYLFYWAEENTDITFFMNYSGSKIFFIVIREEIGEWWEIGVEWWEIVGEIEGVEWWEIEGEWWEIEGEWWEWWEELGEIGVIGGWEREWEIAVEAAPVPVKIELVPPVPGKIDLVPVVPVKIDPVPPVPVKIDPVPVPVPEV